MRKLLYKIKSLPYYVFTNYEHNIIFIVKISIFFLIKKVSEKFLQCIIELKNACYINK